MLAMSQFDYRLNIFAVLLLMVSLIGLALMWWFISRKRRVFYWFSGVFAALIIWSIAYGIELSCQSLECMLYWIRWEYLGICALGPLWFIFSLHYTGLKKWLNRFSYSAAALYGLGSYLLVFTNAHHQLHYRSNAVSEAGPFPLLDIEPGIWYYVHTGVFYFLVLGGYLVLMQHSRRADRIFKRHYQLVVGSTFVPFLVNLAYMFFDLRPYGHIDLTPFAFMASCFIIAWGLWRYGLFEIVPLARSKVIQDLSDGLLIIDLRRRILDYNPAMLMILGQDGSPVVGDLAEEVLASPELPHHLDQASAVSSREWTLARNERQYRVKVSPLQEQKALSGWVLLFSDITEQLNAEQRLQRQREELEKSNRLKDRLLSIVAHDLRGPLRNLQEILRLSNAQALSAEDRDALLTALGESVDQNVVLMENLLAWAQGQMQEAKIFLEAFNIGDLLQEAQAQMKPQAQAKGLKFQAVPLPAPIIVCADRASVRLVLRNLLNNAIKFTPAGKQIGLQCVLLEDQRRCRISVIDEGVGIAPDLIPALLAGEGHSTEGTAQEKGTGLGLALCRDYLNQNGSALELQSRLGEGSVFSFHLALA